MTLWCGGGSRGVVRRVGGVLIMCLVSVCLCVSIFFKYVYLWVFILKGGCWCCVAVGCGIVGGRGYFDRDDVCSEVWPTC